MKTEENSLFIINSAKKEGWIQKYTLSIRLRSECLRSHRLFYCQRPAYLLITFPSGTPIHHRMGVPRTTPATAGSPCPCGGFFCAFLCKKGSFPSDVSIECFLPSQQSQLFILDGTLGCPRAYFCLSGYFFVGQVDCSI